MVDNVERVDNIDPMAFINCPELSYQVSVKMKYERFMVMDDRSLAYIRQMSKTQQARENRKKKKSQKYQDNLKKFLFFFLRKVERSKQTKNRGERKTRKNRLSSQNSILSYF